MDSCCSSIKMFSWQKDIWENFEEYKKDTRSGWRCVSSNALFGKTIKEVMNSGKSLSRVQWSLSNPDGISYAFDGIPFICIGTLNYHCHQGEDIDKSTKIKRAKERDENEGHDHTFRKRKKHFQPTKKIGCPSKVYMSRIFKFPQYKVEVSSGAIKPRRKMQERTSLLKTR
ncbi:uncharacterized protein LOC124456900 [Xenia sp. Carnegie-2017]|uniref:uncharacterized protein LOC124440470 n=1 Tax=Xenia sp. Carnegie-2017 TaxID=2897299 RepID=UPI001F03FB93|nr:uncharacterized protein LOC124440470 [Xenia sp. Carnegie-2017]XP_046863164.1 uncharacterized protein LOC124456900 [Xenia sp. Carnegie-2017]